MKGVHFNWTGTEDSEEGHAIYSRDGKTFLSLNLPSYKHAHAISQAMDVAIRAGYFDGVLEAESAMKIAMRKLIK